MSQQQIPAAQQLSGAQQQLLNAYVQREQARKQLEQIDSQILAFTNLLAGAELGQKVAAEAVPSVPPPQPPVDNKYVEKGAEQFTRPPEHERALHKRLTSAWVGCDVEGCNIAGPHGHANGPRTN